MARTPEQQAAVDAARAAKTARAAKPAATMGSVGPAGPVPGAYVPPVATGPAGPVSAYEAPGAASSMPTHPMQGARAAPPVAPVAPTMGSMGPLPESSMPRGPASPYPNPTGPANAYAAPQVPGAAYTAPGASPSMPVHPMKPTLAVLDRPLPPSSMPTGPSSAYDAGNGRPMNNTTPWPANGGPQQVSMRQRFMQGAERFLADPKAQLFGKAGAAGLAGVPAALDTGKVLADNQTGGSSTGIDVATQAAAGTGRTAAAVAGGLAGATLGLPAAPATFGLAPLVTGALGAAGGYYAADKAIGGLRSAAGVEPTDPVQRIDSQNAARDAANAQKAAEAAAQAKANVTADVQSRVGFTPSTAGAGRGGAGDMRRTDMPGAAPLSGAPLESYLAGGGDGRGFNPTNGRGGGADRRLPSDLSMLQDGEVYKTKDPVTGRTVYSGRNVKENAGMRNAYGVATGQLTNNPGGNNFVTADDGGKEARRQDGMELQRLVAERQQREAGYAANQSGGGLGGFGGGTLSSGLRESHNRQSTAMSTNTVGQRSQRQQDALDMQKAQLAQSRETAQMQNATTQAGQTQGMRVAEMNNATHREGLNVQREGHALTHETNMLQRKIAMGQQQYQREKDSIELGMKEREFQTGRSDKDFEQKGTREKALQTKIEQRFTSNHPLTGNPQVDANQVRVFRENMDRAVARLGADGVHKLSPKDEEKLFAATGLLQKVQANASNINPLKPDLLRTVDALDLTNLQQDPKTGDFHIHSPDNPKVHGQVIPKWILNTEEAHFFTLGGLRGTPTNRNDILVNGARQ